MPPISLPRSQPPNLMPYAKELCAAKKRDARVSWLSPLKTVAAMTHLCRGCEVAMLEPEIEYALVEMFGPKADDSSLPAFWPIPSTTPEAIGALSKEEPTPGDPPATNLKRFL